MIKKISKMFVSAGAAGDVIAQMESDVDVGEVLDTKVRLTGEWWIAGEKREEFCNKLGALIDEYRI